MTFVVFAPHVAAYDVRFTIQGPQHRKLSNRLTNDARSTMNGLRVAALNIANRQSSNGRFNLRFPTVYIVQRHIGESRFRIGDF